MNARRLWPLVADLACVLALALGGKGSHEPGESDWILLTIAWPFALAVLLGHLMLAWRGRSTQRVWTEGATVVAVTYVLGMLLRALTGRGMAPGFLVVAFLFLVVTMLGWRVAVVVATRVRTRRTPEGSVRNASRSRRL